MPLAAKFLSIRGASSVLKTSYKSGAGSASLGLLAAGLLFFEYTAASEEKGQKQSNAAGYQ